MPRFKLIDGSIVTVSDSEVDEFLTREPGAQRIDGRRSVRGQVRQNELARQNLKEQELERTAVEDLNKARDRETYPQFEQRYITENKSAKKARFDRGYYTAGEKEEYQAYRKTGKVSNFGKFTSPEDVFLSVDKQTLQQL